MGGVEELREILAKVKKELQSAGPVMGVLVDMIIVSEVWSEDGRLHILAWLPDIDPEKRVLRFRRKHIVYDREGGRVLEIRDAEA